MSPTTDDEFLPAAKSLIVEPPSSDDKSLGVGAIAGIVVAVGLVLFGVIAATGNVGGGAAAVIPSTLDQQVPAGMDQQVVQQADLPVINEADEIELEC